MLRVGLIGYGYWGPNLARNINAHEGCELVRVADMLENRRKLVRKTYPAVDVVEDAERVTHADDIDLVVVATPVFTHFALAREALLHGKHVWVEKPMTSNSEQAQELVDLAESRGLQLVVDHTFLFTGAVRKMKELVDAGEIGDIFYYDSVRINLGLFQHDINVIWDLAPHDFSVMDHLLGPTARAISAHGSGHFGTGLEDVAYLIVYYDNNVMAHLHLNWLSPVKVRRTIIGGSKKMLLWDDLNMEERIKIYDKGMEVTTKEGLYQVLATPRHGAVHAPVVPGTEALQAELDYFVRCLQSGERPFNDGAAGARMVRLLEATDRSLRNQGRAVELA